MSLDAVQFAILIQCPRCGASTPFNGLTASVLCAHCAEVIPLTEDRWLRLIGDFVREDLRVDWGETDNTEVVAPWGKFSIEHGHCEPVCPHCTQSLPKGVWQDLTGPIHCPACGGEISVRPPPDWYAEANPSARWLVGETFEADVAVQREEGPISIHCINCGANLGIDGKTRTVVCEHCDSDNFLPDQIWLRLHPASVRRPWTILFDTGATGYLLPDHIEDFCDVAHAPDGGLIAAFVEDSDDYDDEDDDDEDEEDDEIGEDEPRARPIAARIVKFDQQGLVAWLRKDIDFDDDARLLCTADGSTLLLILSRGEGFHVLDPMTGQTLDRIDCPDTTGEQPDRPPEELRPLQLYNSEGTELAPDGTLVVLRNGPADAEPVLTRYQLDGTPVPMWPAPAEPSEPSSEEAVEDTPKKVGFFRRLFGGGAEEPAEPEKPATACADWDDLPERILVPPRGVQFTFSPLGDLILVSKDRDRLAHYSAQGELIESHRVEGYPEVHDWYGIGADQFECVYLAYEPPDYWMSGGGQHLIRMPLGGEPEVFRGWTVNPTCQLGNSDAEMKVRADGTLYLGGGVDNLRVVSPEGQYLFRSPATVELDGIDRQRYEENN